MSNPPQPLNPPRLFCCLFFFFFSLRANPHNGVLHAGHHNGVVTMWSPAMGTPLVRMLAHPAPITSLAVEQNGHYMVTSGMDKQVRACAEGWGPGAL